MNDDGTPRYTQTQTLSADEQTKYDQNNQVAIALNGLAQNNIGRVTDAQSKPFTYDGMTPVTSNVQAGKLSGLSGLTNIADAGKLQTDLDYSGLTALPGTDDFSADAAKTAKTVYDQAASRLDPQWQQNDNDTRAALAAQGISENSDAWRRSYDNMQRSKTDAYNQANFAAQQAGSAEQSRLFGLALSARQQGKDEVDTQGTFHNGAQGQQFEQNAARTTVGNANTTAQTAMDNTNQGVAFNQGAANATLGNSARQQEIEQAAYLRNMPINDIAALLGTGSQVAAPDFQPVSQVGVAAPDYAGMVQNQYTNNLGLYKDAQANKSAALGSIFGAAGTAATMFSDRRLKTDIKRIGTLANGLATYAFKYIGSTAQQFGVMAQEVLKVRPDAVSVGEGGYLRVNYGKVY